MTEAIIQYIGMYLTSEPGIASNPDVICIGTIMVKIQQILDKEQSDFPNDVYLFHYVYPSNSSSSQQSHAGSQTAIS